MYKRNKLKKKENLSSKPSLSKYLKKEKYWILGFVATEIFANLSNIANTLLIAKCIEAITLSDFSSTYTLLGFSIGLLLFRRFCHWIGYKCFIEGTTRLSFSVRVDLMDRMFRLSSKTFTDSNSGLFVTRVVNDSEDTFVRINNIIEGIAYVLTSIVTIVYISIINYIIGIIFAVALIALSFYERKRKILGRKNKRIVRTAQEDITSLTSEIVKSEKDIKALDLEEKLKETSKDKFTHYKHAFRHKELVDSAFWNSRSIIVEIIVGVALFIALWQVTNGFLTIASMLFIYMNKDSYFNLIWYIGDISKCLTEAKVSSERMFEIFDEEKFPSEHFGDKELKSCNGDIEFQNVCFSYEDNFTADGENQVETTKKSRRKKKSKIEQPKEKSFIKVFENLSFKIEANKTTAFVGQSGSGKSTILSLMSKMYVVDSGSVMIDGTNINELSERAIRDNISLVNQFPYIFNTSIKKNLLMAKKDATDAEIMDAIKRAAFLPFVLSLKNGINTKVGEGGIKLSGGQKQRLAIARALLRNSKIILFDESTSSLDNFAQEEIKDSIAHLSGGNTVVMVAHRLSTIKNADKIYFLDHGVIAGEGTFEELYNNNILFQKMFQTENI